ncbi:AraC family transcriptional regulator [Synoicihabitans lomoniglobus]|uniref:DNA-binding transcriptional regulator n=1 Tax=Synoicihabitans lomoniglobus TaxID=2909285 RepID=A0AAF0CQ51_9BACT|nr:DNA-binding transcriptional regulator [Opitutaceae bacterium LMO-M01]WED65987.1 DNA-binding transcriptional regulator [Opitutaceae bacterium LMO-M01]
METSNAYARNLLHGVVRYVREHTPWSLFLVEQSRGQTAPEWVANWRGDGIIARIENPQVADAVLASGLPAVDLSAGRFAPSLPWVETDDVQIARMAFNHLADRGFKAFAYGGDERFMWSRSRGVEFARLVQARGCRLHELPPSAQVSDVAQQVDQLEQWVAGLPKPIGIFACYDIRGQQLLDACRNLGVAVPEEVAVVGVDDDDLLCQLAFPPLSSVQPNARHTGYTAAALLDAMMNGAPREAVEIRVPPLGVTARQSTDILAVSDTIVVRALRFIREHACDPIAVTDVLATVPVSRRVLEKRFEQAVGHSPHAEIVAVRMNRVKELLLETDLSLEMIAARTGFEHPEYLTVMFKREVGVPPGRFRKRAMSE